MMAYFHAFVALWLWRYTRLIINIIAAWTLRPIRPSFWPTFTAEDVTVVLATLGTNDEFSRCIRCIDACSPKAIVVVTPQKNVNRIRKICENLGLYKTKVLGSEKANKRLQMIQGLKTSTTAITVFADDDVYWRPTFLTYILAAFEDPKVGAAGGLTSPDRTPDLNMWEFLGAAYLERWNFEISATSHMDSGVTCLSGRTTAVRTEIVQEEDFLHEFAHEKWLGIVSLATADDDCCMTRWIVNHGWKIRIQCAKEAELTTALENDSTFLGQCVRWTRTLWRNHVTSMVVDRKIWRQQPWSSYALYLSIFNPPALVVDGLLAYLLHRCVNATPPSISMVAPTTAYFFFGLWLLFTKTVKLFPYFYQYPSDMKFIPALILFGYFHGFIKLYTLLTLNKASARPTSWDGNHSLLTNPAIMSSDTLLRGTSSDIRYGIGSLKQLKSAASLKTTLNQSAMGVHEE